MQMHWVIDTILAERASEHTGFPSLADAAREAGHVVHLTKYVPIAQDLEPRPYIGHHLDPKAVVYHGTFEGLRAFRKLHVDAFQWQPKSYCIEDNLKFSAYAHRYGNHMLNREYCMITYGELKRRGPDWSFFRYDCSGHMFIRPDDVTKTFSGRVVTRSDFDHEINSLNQIEIVPDTCMVVCAPARTLVSEARFVIANNEVVTGSTYRYNDVLDIRQDVFPEQWALAHEVARNPFWSPDNVYVVDIAMMADNGGARIIEFNSFSCSGLYACDTRAIVNKVTTAAMKEFEYV